MQFTRRQLMQGAVGGAAVALAGGSLGRRARAANETPLMTPRRPTRIVAPRSDMVGEVFAVRRTIPAVNLAQVDPFLMLDHFDFTLTPGQLGGLAPHPHRGI